MSTFYVVATPIGNLGDVSKRALNTLKEVDLILAEDTRVTRKLLSHYDIHTPLKRFDSHSDVLNTITKIADKNVALVTDAGTPGISDPGGKLVAKLASQEHVVVPIPGPSAVITALSVSGFPTDRFIFLGFVPQKKGRAAFLKQVAEQVVTSVFYESTHRILKLLDELENILEDSRQLLVARELTKLHESLYRGNVSQIREEMKVTKGEFTIVISPK